MSQDFIVEGMKTAQCSATNGVQACEEEATGSKLTESAVMDSNTPWFCSRECKRIYENLDRVAGGLGPIGNRRFELVGQNHKGRGVTAFWSVLLHVFTQTGRAYPMGSDQKQSDGHVAPHGYLCMTTHSVPQMHNCRTFS